MKSTQNNESKEAATAILNAFVASLQVSCYATQDNKQSVYKGEIATSELPWGDEQFLEKLVKMAFKSMVYRSEKAKKALGIEAGEEVTTAMFVAAVLATSFQGEEAPNAADKKNAETILKGIAAETVTWEQVEKKITSAKGLLRSKDEAGLVQYFFEKRLKEAAKAGLDLL